MSSSCLRHATCVSVKGVGILLEGPSGVGKSDLALRLIDQGAILVADDQVVITRGPQDLLASPPATTAGLLEVRGLGLFTQSYAPSTPVHAVITLESARDFERLPLPESIGILGFSLPHYRLNPTVASATARVRLLCTTLLEQQVTPYQFQNIA